MRTGGGLGVVVLAVLLAGACGGGPAEETAPPPTPLPDLRTPTTAVEPSEAVRSAPIQTPDPEMDHQQLLAAIPAPIRGGCRRAEPLDDGLATAVCVSGEDQVSYSLFPGDEALGPAFRARMAALPDGATDGPGCGEGPGQGRLPVGRLACYRESDGTAVTIWTNELAFVLATASRADGDWKALEAFRQSAGPVTP